MTEENSGSGPGGGNSDGGSPDGGAQVTEAATLLGDVKRLRRQTRSARHAYWLPLVLFGLLTCASVPFYIRPLQPGGASGFGVPAFYVRGFAGFTGQGWREYLALYWLVAIAAGLTLTFLWYRRHGRQVGLVTPARGFLMTGVIVSLLALVLSAVGSLPGTWSSAAPCRS